MSTIIPIILPVNAYVICVNILNNLYSNPSNILFTWPLNNSFGGLVTSTPMLIWNEIYNGQCIPTALILQENTKRNLMLILIKYMMLIIIY